MTTPLFVGALIVAAGGVTLVVLSIVLFALHRSAHIPALRRLAAVGLSLGVGTIALGGVLAIPPPQAQAIPGSSVPTYVVTPLETLAPSTEDTVLERLDLQLPTIALD